MNDRFSPKPNSDPASQPTVKQSAPVHSDETLPLTEDEPLKHPIQYLKSIGFCFSRTQVFSALGLAIGSAALTVWNPLFLQQLDRSIQTVLKQTQALQLNQETPYKIVIVTLDDDSLNQFKQPFPIKRRLQAQVINRLMEAGARTIAVDFVFDLPTGESPAIDPETTTDCNQIKTEQLSEDDRLLKEALDKYRDRIVLAAKYDRITSDNWQQTQLTRPYCPFQGTAIGTINFPTEPDGRIHKFGNPENLTHLTVDNQVPSFVDAIAKQSQWKLPEGVPQDISFLGVPGQSLQNQTVPMWHILSDENWNSDRLQQGEFFRNQIVLIGTTAQVSGDFLTTPVGRMAGVELHAHALAARMRSRQVSHLFTQPWHNALLVFGLVGLMTLALLRIDRVGSEKSPRLAIWQIPGWFLLIGLGWLLLGYSSLVSLSRHLPLAAPSLSFTLAAFVHPLLRLGSDRKNQEQLRNTLKRYGSSPLIQEIIGQQPDPSLRNLLTERQEELQGKKLAGRYEIVEILGSGGFSETYKAKDLQLPGTPICLVKQLRPRSDSLSHLALARRLFDQEARTLQELGRHDRIPQLLAFFEEDREFYLIQQFVPGQPLSQTLTLGRQLPEANVINILVEILTILNFVHYNQVIHRDVKPSNIIQRSNDQHLVLIDFGAVKALETMPDPDQPSDLTVGIGTQGYMAPEQQLGNPRPNSDLYSLGILAIQALTGLPARQLLPDPETHSLNWEIHVMTVSRPLRTIVNRLVAYNYRDRYQNAREVLTDLEPLSTHGTLLPKLLELEEDSQEFDVPTQLWSADGEATGMPVTEQPPTDRLP